MTTKSNMALILGAASPLGCTVMRLLVTDGVSVIATDTASHGDFLADFKSSLGADGERIYIQTGEMDDATFGMGSVLEKQLDDRPARIFSFVHIRDRKLTSSDIKRRNRLIRTRLLDTVRRIANLQSLVVVTDVGLIGDYPGRFSENWVDVGQIPFDEVDRSSIGLEKACLQAFQEHELPIVRARTGLLFNYKELPFTEKAPHWKSAAEELIPSIKVLGKFPRFLSIPSAVTKGSLAPLTPIAWAAKAIVRLSIEPQAVGKAFHLVLDPPPSMEDVLKCITESAGGAKIKGGLPVTLLGKLGIVPGFKETARRQSDQIASWWTPHRYCLSKNELDTHNVTEILSEQNIPLSWEEVGEIF
jgi:nucleoside-diphosphate-sugar epimerase